MTHILEQFYMPFNSAFLDAKKTMKSIKREGIPTKVKCPVCGNQLLIRAGRYGLFLGCVSYPDCSYTKKLVSESAGTSVSTPTDKVCSCGAPMVMRQGKSGPFLACSRYPECKGSGSLSTGTTCPKCGEGALVQKRTKRGRSFYGCDQYPKCDFSMWNKPVPMKCPNPDCDSSIMEEKNSKKEGRYLHCPKCDTKQSLDDQS